MDINEAIEIAKKYVESRGEILPGFRYNFGKSREFLNHFYFDFIFVTLDGKVPEDPPIAGGACGFLINKDNKEIDVLSFGEFAELSVKNRKIDELYQQLLDIKRNNKSLNIIKTKYNLTSNELLMLKKNLSKVNLDKHSIYKQLDKLLKSE